MTKKNYDIIARQREDIMKAYRKIAPTCHSQQEAWEKLVKSPAPRYYVSARRAWDKLRRMVVGDFSVADNMKPIRRRMYYSLYDKLMEMSQRKEYMGQSLWFICQFLVTEPAPEFFCTPASIRDIFHKYKRYGRDYRESELRRQKKLAKKAAAK